MPVGKRALAIAVIIVAIIIIGAAAILMQRPAVKPAEIEIVIGTTDAVKHLDPARAYDFMSCNVIYNE